MRNHLVICGFGSTGQSAADELIKRGENPSDIIVVDSDPTACDHALAAGFVTVTGNATQSAVLAQARVQDARAVIVAPNRDDTAVLVTLTARELNRTAHIVAAGREQENLHLLRQGGANEVIDATAAVGRMLGLATTSPGAVIVIDDLLDSGTGLDLHEVAPVRTDDGFDAPHDATVVAVIRNGDRVSPTEMETIRFQADDRLIVLSEEP